eukprot:GILK01005398.1.p1 GENE.GILK01005398.1~~GILK01005398.1.p1  ORF type:complete len:368 (-),score=50.19 GILK01005398.1:55-1116(-)
MADDDWVVGVWLAVLSSVMTNLGTTLQKLSHKHNSSLPSSQQITYIKQWRWWTGFGIFLASQFVNTAALAFAPESLVAPLASVSIMMNAVTSYCILHEQLTSRDLLATCIVSSGGVLCIVFGPHPPDKNFELIDLMSYWMDTGVVLYLIVFGTVTFFLVFKSYQIERNIQTGSSSLHPTSLLHGPRFLSLSYPLLAGLLSSFSLLLTKCFAETLRQTLEGHSQLDKPFTYVITAATVVVALSSLFYINQGLKAFDAKYMVPFYFTVYVVLTIVEGIIYFHEWDDITPIQGFIFSMSVLFTCSGILLLSTGQPAGSDKVVFKRVNTEEEGEPLVDLPTDVNVHDDDDELDDFYN